MNKKIWIAICVLWISFWFVTGCAKQLMPPDVEPTSGITEQQEKIAESDVAPDADLAMGGGESGPIFQEEEVSDGSLATTITEEDAQLAENPEQDWTSERDFDFSPSGDRDFGSGQQGMPGNGSDGSYVSGPYQGNGDSMPVETVTEGSQSDNSGFGFDSADETGSVASVPVDEQAVPMPEAKDGDTTLMAFQPTTALKDIHFQFDQFDLDARSKEILRINAQYMKDHPSVKVEIQGHCDERGTNNYNLALGERRSKATKNYLISQGVDPDRLFTISYGEEKPFCLESDENCWWKNRRAHFIVYEDKV